MRTIQPIRESRLPGLSVTRWAALLLAFALVGIVQAAQYDFDARNATVTALLEAGQRLDSAHTSDHAFALVRKVQSEAVAAFQGGNAEAGYERLDQAYVLVQAAVRRLASDPGMSERLLAPERVEPPADPATATRVDTLFHSVTALQAAYRSIRDEVADPGTDLGPEVTRRIQASQWLREAGRQTEAQRHLKEAYVMLQGEIVRLRGGQTLVKELRFASDAEEYSYEVDRHDSHLLLVELLLRRSDGDPGRTAEIEDAVDESMRLHWVAHKHAAAGDYRRAVAWLELASDALVALIREQGFDIPRQ